MRSRFLLSRSRVLEKYAELCSISDVVSYSFKTNRHVGKVLHDSTDCMFSVHSREDISLLSDASRIWFFAQAWSLDDVSGLVAAGVAKFVVDNMADLDVLLGFLENNDVNVDLLLRMRLKEHTVHTGKHFVFGFYSYDINQLVPKLRLNPKISRLGVHVHRKTQNVSEWSLREEFESCLDDGVLHRIDLVDIGGGLPAVYKNFRVEVVESIFDKIRVMREWLNSNNIMMIVEPGRFIAAPAVKLETEIISVYGSTVVVDASVFNSAMDTFVANIRLLVEGELGKGASFTIKGCTPDSMDILRYQVFLSNPKVGDRIVFLNAGAYNFCCDFCGLKRIPTEVVG